MRWSCGECAAVFVAAATSLSLPRRCSPRRCWPMSPSSMPCNTGHLSASCDDEARRDASLNRRFRQNLATLHPSDETRMSFDLAPPSSPPLLYDFVDVYSWSPSSSERRHLGSQRIFVGMWNALPLPDVEARHSLLDISAMDTFSPPSGLDVGVVFPTPGS
ncbi:hypothetical protein R3P38DRAFT_3184841 [Favolaschia claudopus]|uniref:Uncharacterized protein n=1 Tax=Favolaschia claudopus TaxID=2862362 RepID=A0AAW0C8P8_9AGAR